MTSSIIFSIADGIATIRLNRPEAMNTMNPELMRMTAQALERSWDDPAVRVVKLTGTDNTFSAGGDLNRFAADDDDLSTINRTFTLREHMRISQLLFEMPKPTIAAINGACAGAGLAWACAADLRYCIESAVFNTAFLSAGLSGDFGGSWTLPRIVGPAKAREMYFLPEKFSGTRAMAIGLVNKCVADSQLDEHVNMICQRLIDSAPQALAAIKANFNDSITNEFTKHLDSEALRHSHCRNTNDSKEAAMAFLERRKPSFNGS